MKIDSNRAARSCLGALASAALLVWATGGETALHRWARLAAPRTPALSYAGPGHAQKARRRQQSMFAQQSRELLRRCQEARR